MRKMVATVALTLRLNLGNFNVGIYWKLIAEFTDKPTVTSIFRTSSS